MAIPPDIKIRLEQLRNEMAARAEAQLRQQQAQQNAEKMSKQFVPGKAKGGSMPSLDTMKLALNKQGMYSPLEKAAMAVPRTKGTPAEFMAEVSKQPGFRKDEVEDRRISLPEQKMTKEEFLGHLKNHPAPLLEEKVLGGDQYREELDNVAKEIIGDDYVTYDDLHGRDQVRAEATVMQRMGYDPETKYDEWALPGGDNYREVLLNLPRRGLTDQQREQLMWYEADMRRGKVLGSEKQKRYEELKARQKAEGQDYHSSHWQEHPNVLAHLRLSDRTGPNGEKILHVDEVQSDWHQQGRKEGYNDASGKLALNQEVERLAAKYGISPNEPNKLSKLRSVVDSDELGNLMDLNKSANTGVPDAPFKKNWHELALKHVLGEAARGGYDGIAITPGDVQAKRYDLSKHINKIDVGMDESGEYSVVAEDKNGREVMNQLVPAEKLADHVGKEMADKIVNKIKSPDEVPTTFSGLDLKVGGEGMRGFYDKMIPAFLNKIGKPHGAQVGTIDVKTPKGQELTSVEDIANGLGMTMEEYVNHPDFHQLEKQYWQMQKNATTPLHYFPITDSLRQQVKTEGLPQYERGGNVHPLLPDFED